MLFILILFFNHLYCQDSGNRDVIINNQVVKFQSLLYSIESQYVDSVDIEKIAEASFKALLRELDNQSYYFTSSEYKEIVRQQKGESSYGIGISFKVFQDTCYITDVIPNSSADSIGLEVGDVILFADGQKITGSNSSKANSTINGAQNTKLELIIKKNSEVGLLELTANRGVYPVSSVDAAFLISNSKIGYIKISSFTQTTYQDFIAEVNALKKLGLEKIIFDLRNVPGGLLEEAIKITGLFLEKDKLITKLTGKNKAYENEYKSTVEPIFKDIPLSIIVNKETASAGEILAGAIQDYDRGLVIGEKTFGKGTVQNAWVFGDSSAFRMTITKYTTPSGRPVEKTDKGEEVNLDTRFMDENIKKQIEKSMALFGNSKTTGVFKSEGGRLILAPGGIIPDKVIEEDTLTLLTRVYIERDYITEYALKYSIANKRTIKETYKDDYIKFIEKFEITPQMFDEFAKVIDQYKVFNKEMYEQDKAYIINYLKASIAKLIWGQDAFHYGLLYIDKLAIETVKSIPNSTSVVE